MTIAVTWKPLPWSPGAAAMHVMPEGLSLAEIVAGYPEPLPEAFDEFGTVCVNGEPVLDRAWWPHVRPRRDGPVPVTVTLVMLPHGGGSRRTVKNIASIVGSIALVAATAWIGGGGIPGLNQFASKLLAGVVGVAGSLALRALAPPPPKVGGDGRQRTIQAGASINILAPGAQLPTIFGRMRASPPGLVQPYTVLDNNSLYTCAVVGLAGQHDVTQVRINETLADAVPFAIKYQVRDGASGNPRLLLNAQTVIEQPFGQKAGEFDLDSQGRVVRSFDQYPSWTQVRSRGTPEEMRIRLLWPAGMNCDGDWVRQWVRIKIRRPGAGSWSILPTVYFQSSAQREFRQEIRLVWRKKTGSYANPMSNSGWHYGVKVFACAETMPPTHSSTFNTDDYYYQADAIFRSTTTFGHGKLAKYTRANKDGITIYLDVDNYPPDTYEVRVCSGLPLSKKASGLDQAYRAFSLFRNKSGWTVADYKENMNAQHYIESVSTMRSDYPLGFQGGVTLIAVRAKNMPISSISAIFTKVTKIYSGGNWNTRAATTNPAAMLRHVWRDSLNREPLSSIMCDDANLADFYTWCSAQGLHCNATIDGGSVEQAMMTAAAAGHAAVRRSETYGVIIERSRAADPIRQTFTPANTRNNRVDHQYPMPLDGLRVSYFDEDDEYRAKEAVVLDDGVSAGDAKRIEAQDYPGKTNLAEVRRRAKLDMRQMRLRCRRYSFETDSQFLVCQRGDLVSYTFDVLDRSSDAAWVTGVTRDGSGLVKGLTLTASVFQAPTDGLWTVPSIFDASSVFSIVSNPGVQVRLLTGATGSYRILENTSTDQVTLVTPQNWPDSAIVGALVVAGIYTQETRRCVVWDIDPTEDFTARVTLLDEAPGIPT